MFDQFEPWFHQQRIIIENLYNINIHHSLGASSVYYNLHRLSRLFKDQVAYPLLSFMRAGMISVHVCNFL